MTISTEQIFKEILDLDSEQIPVARLAFFREELRNRLHAEVVRRFHALADAGFTKARLARRIGRTPEQVIRWLGAPGNWTLDTASDLLIGMRAVPIIETDDLVNRLTLEEEAEAEIIAATAAQIANQPKSTASIGQPVISPSPFPVSTRSRPAPLSGLASTNQTRAPISKLGSS